MVDMVTLPCVWSGSQYDLPSTHNNEAKRKHTSFVEIFNLTTGNWKRTPTTGKPPLGVSYYASAVIDNNIIFWWILWTWHLLSQQPNQFMCGHNAMEGVVSY